MGNEKTLSGQVALVTGASRGIGRAIAVRLAAEGASVAVNYRERAAEAEAVVNEIVASGGRAMSVQADISKPAEVAAMAKAIEGQLGAPGILVNNAGVLRTGDLADFDFSQMEYMRQTNVDGLVAVTRSVIGPMKERRYGRIVNLSSIAAMGTSFVGNTFYGATKAAVLLLTRRFAMDLGPFGITVNAIAPGFIVTDMVRQGRSPEDAEALIGRIAEKAMTRRTGIPEDIAHAVSFLVSPRSGFVTAQTLTVDGGRMDYMNHP